MHDLKMCGTTVFLTCGEGGSNRIFRVFQLAILTTAKKRVKPFPFVRVRRVVSAHRHPPWNLENSYSSRARSTTLNKQANVRLPFGFLACTLCAGLNLRGFPM